MYIITEKNIDIILAELGNLLFDKNECVFEQKLATYKKMKFEMRTKENGHNVPHIHVSYNRKNVTISINDGSILKGELPDHKKIQAQKWVLDNKAELIEKWREMFGDRGLHILNVID